MFCHDRRIRDRRVVYVSEETHQKLGRIAFLFRNEYQTVVSLADAIITHHIDTHRELLNRLEDEQNQAFLSHGKPANTPESCPDDDSDE